jgi:hypothetical protein
VTPPVLTLNDTGLLERLALRADATAIRPGAGGVRRTRGRGPGTEFHEFRPYQPGDDLRTVDWTVEARLHQLVVRVPRAHGHLRVHVLVDVSASMSIGEPAKLACAAQVAAAVCYIAARHRDAAGVSTFRERITSYMPRLKAGLSCSAFWKRSPGSNPPVSRRSTRRSSNTRPRHQVPASPSCCRISSSVAPESVVCNIWRTGD